MTGKRFALSCIRRAVLITKIHSIIKLYTLCWSYILYLNKNFVGDRHLIKFECLSVIVDITKFFELQGFVSTSGTFICLSKFNYIVSPVRRLVYLICESGIKAAGRRTNEKMHYRPAVFYIYLPVIAELVWYAWNWYTWIQTVAFTFFLPGDIIIQESAG